MRLQGNPSVKGGGSMRRHHVLAEKLLAEASASAVANTLSDQVILVGQVTNGGGSFSVAHGQGMAGKVSLKQPWSDNGLALLSLREFGAVELFSGSRTGSVGITTDVVVSIPKARLQGLAAFARELSKTSGLTAWEDLLYRAEGW